MIFLQVPLLMTAILFADALYISMATFMIASEKGTKFDAIQSPYKKLIDWTSNFYFIKEKLITYLINNH